MFRRTHVTRFLRDESAAVTVEYVVLAAAVTGMALLSSDVIYRGLGALAGTVDGELQGESTTRTGALSYDDGFENGAAGWAGAAASAVRGFGNILGPITGSGGAASVTREFEFAEGTPEATFSFDLLAMDSLDGESGIVYIDGQEVGRMTTDFTTGTVFTPADGIAARGISFQTRLEDDRVDLGGTSAERRFVDSRAKILVTVANPASKVTFGFGSTANHGAHDESFGIDNFRATGLKDPGSS